MAQAGPPPMSRQAIEATKAECASFEDRFNDASEPLQFRNKFLDVDLTIRMLTRLQQRRQLICELLLYTLLVILYCVYLFQFVSSPEVFYMSSRAQQLLVTRPFGVASRRFVPGPDGPKHCIMPNAGFDPSGIGNPGAFPDNNTFVSCAQFGSQANFVQVNSITLAYYWLVSVLYDPELSTWSEPLTYDLASISKGMCSRPEDGGRGARGGGAEDAGGIGTIPRVLSDQMFTAVGAIRLRQVRVTAGQCLFGGAATAESSAQCARPIAPDTELTEAFTALGGKVYSYSSAEELARARLEPPAEANADPIVLDSALLRSPNSFIQGKVARYPRSGYVIDIEGANWTAATEAANEVISQAWIDDRTAAFFMSMTLYNLNLNMFMPVTFMIEQSAYGFVTNAHWGRPFSPLPIQGTETLLEVAILALASLLLAFFIFNLVRELRTTSFMAAFLGWTMYDILNLTLVVASISMRMHLRLGAAGRMVSNASALLLLQSSQRNVFTDYYEAYSEQLVYSDMISALSLIVCFLKFFKYLDLNKRFSIVLTTFVQSRRLLRAWLVFVLVVLAAFVFYTHFSFGWFMPRFTTANAAAQALLLYMVQVFSQDTLTSFSGSDGGGRGGARTASVQRQMHEVDGGGGGAAHIFAQRPMSLAVYQVTDFGYTLSLTSALVFALLFVVAVNLVITNVFQAVLIASYQEVVKDVTNDENLRREQSETLRRSRTVLQESWIRTQIKNASDMLRFEERRLVLDRLKTAPETTFRNLLSYHEVRAILCDVVHSEARATELAWILMSLYQTTLSRIHEAAVLFEDRKIALLEGKRSFTVRDEDLPVVRPSDAFDPSQREKWARDLQSGDLVQSLFFVHCLQMEQSTKEFENKLRSLETVQQEIYQHSLALEAAVAGLEQRQRQRQGDLVPEMDPWAPREATCVEPLITGRFAAHHVDAAGVHRYLGAFSTAAEAEAAVEAQDAKLAGEEEKEARQAAPENSSTGVAQVAQDVRGLVLGASDSEASDSGDSGVSDDGDSDDNSSDGGGEGESRGGGGQRGRRPRRRLL